MKNKTKLQKIKSGNKPQAPKLPSGWFYMTPQPVKAEEIYEALKGQPGIEEIELWSDAGILEIVLGEKSSMDVEPLAENYLKDEFSLAFLEAHEVTPRFYISFRPEEYQKAETVMKTLVSKLGGLIAGDSEDFEPILK